MAIYHFSAQMISRSKGQSAVAAAAYRSGERLKDERTNERKFYKREVKPETMILAPSHAPEWVQDRNRLWNHHAEGGSPGKLPLGDGSGSQAATLFGLLQPDNGPSL